jgi:hypothetical protein
VEHAEVERVILTAWPRLYLDTGDIIDIADDRVDPVLVENLTSASYERGVILVVSIAHFQDILQVDQPSRDRISTALERFRLRAFVMQGPPEVEFAAGGAVDIDLNIAGNIRELNDASKSASSLRTLQAAQDSLHRAFVGYQQARARQPRQVSTQAANLGMQVLISLVRGWLAEDAETVLEYWRLQDGLELDDWERDALLEQIRPFAKLLSEIQRMPDLPESWRTVVLDALRASVNHSSETPTPGHYVSGQLNGANMMNITRGPKASDILDVSHVAHLPYVDIATCDRAAFAAVSRRLRRIRCPRTVQLFRNRHLSDVLEAVRRLPNAREALIEEMHLG